MNVKLKDYIDYWQQVKNATMNTIGKDSGIYPNSDWKRKLLISEHSPIRKLKLSWKQTDLKYFVSVHFVRHKIGIEHWISTQRDDRATTKDQIHFTRGKAPQDAPVSHECEGNAQALITISRKRLCSCASLETREAWQGVKDEVAKVEPELASCMVKDCIYRGHCYEMFSCGYHKTEAFQKELNEYRKGIN